MVKFYRSTAIVCLLLCAFFALMGWLGDFDYCEQVILHMTQEQYDSVKILLTEQDGTAPSDRDIAHWWVEHNTE